MAFEVKRSEAGAEAVRRAFRSQIAKALRMLDKSSTDAAVHAARKELKKARSALRLLRDVLGDSSYRRENTVIRDAARPLSVLRDSKALLSALDNLIKLYGPPARALGLKELRRRIRREGAEARGKVAGAAAMKKNLAPLRELHKRCDSWPVGHHGWTTLGAGLERVYTKGRKAMAAARAESTPEHLHEWRKQVKYLWHELQLLEPLWPALIGELADQAHQLADYLGDDHDLAVLRAKVLAHPEALNGSGDSDALISLIDRCRTQLEEKAFILGKRIYVQKPSAFIEQFERYWHAWRRERVPERAHAHVH